MKYKTYQPELMMWQVLTAIFVRINILRKHAMSAGFSAIKASTNLDVSICM